MDSDRPRERFMAFGGEAMSERELLAVLLGTGRRGASAEQLAGEMLRTAGGIAPLSRASPRELAAVAGIGPARAVRVAAAFHLGRRAVVIDRSAAVVLGSPADVWWRLRSKVAGLSQEIFFVIGLDARGVVIDEVEVARGTLTGVEVHPRDVFRPLIRMSAATGVVAHNHPSGDPSPSPEDHQLTTRLQTIGELIGIPILDHVVLGALGYCAIMDEASRSPSPTG
jgi:DNA repair protein RadC